MTAFWNMGSLALGLLAWAIPCMALGKMTRGEKPSQKFLLSSFTACALSLLFQLFELRNRTRIQDWSAIDDTVGAICMAAVVLVVVTISLNSVALAMGQEDAGA